MTTELAEFLFDMASNGGKFIIDAVKHRNEKKRCCMINGDVIGTNEILFSFHRNQKKGVNDVFRLKLQFELNDDMMELVKQSMSRKFYATNNKNKAIKAHNDKLRQKIQTFHQSIDIDTPSDQSNSRLAYIKFLEDKLLEEVRVRKGDVTNQEANQYARQLFLESNEIETLIALFGGEILNQKTQHIVSIFRRALQERKFLSNDPVVTGYAPKKFWKRKSYPIEWILTITSVDYQNPTKDLKLERYAIEKSSLDPIGQGTKFTGDFVHGVVSMRNQKKKGISSSEFMDDDGNNNHHKMVHIDRKSEHTIEVESLSE